MKKVILVLFLVLIANNILYGQARFVICEDDFEGPQNTSCFAGYYILDNIPSGSNVWQICVPGKPLFNQALSPTHAILTDSTGPYPVNDTSVFLFKAYVYLTGNDVPIFGGHYKFDSDSLKDFGRIDVSYDHGTTWNDILTDTSLYWTTEKPVFTGRVFQWREFSANWLEYPPPFDTLYYRYTFISDSIQTNQQGWMLDNLYVADHIEGISSGNNKNGVSVFPNPAGDCLTVSSPAPTIIKHITIIDLFGRSRIEAIVKGEQSDIDISALEKGFYIMTVNSGDLQSSIRFLKE
jgi:hypothetical protein